MHHATHRWLTTAAALALGASALIAAPLPASAADPVTTSASLPSVAVSIDYSDTTVEAGDTITADVTFENLTGSPQDVGYALAPSTLLVSLFTIDSCTAPTGVAIDCAVFPDDSGLGVSIDDLPSKSTTVSVILTANPSTAPGTYAQDQYLTRPGTMTTLFSPALSFTIQSPTADLAVGLDATPGSLLTSQINYSLAVTNNGPAATTASSVQVALPAQTISVSGLPSGCGYASTTDIVTCNTGAIANTATANRTFTANLSLLTLGPLNATATRVSSTPTDPNSTNDTAVAACTALTSLIITC